VTTQETPTIDAVELAQTCIHRWPAQENIIKDYLLPLGLDTNHGFTKVAVENSEVAKRRAHLEQRLARLKQWAQSAGKREAQASRRRERLRTTYNTRSKELYRELTAYQFTLEEQNLPEYVFRRKLKERKAEIDAELEPLRCKEWQAYEQCNKVVVANLAMWVRDRYFPPSYAQAAWKRLLPFFQLPGTITQDSTIVQVELCPFNDRALNRDLAVLCERVNQASPCLPDGRRLSFTIRPSCCIRGSRRRKPKYRETLIIWTSLGHCPSRSQARPGSCEEVTGLLGALGTSSQRSICATVTGARNTNRTPMSKQ
jgi:hypothetical protein